MDQRADDDYFHVQIYTEEEKDTHVMHKSKQSCAMPMENQSPSRRASSHETMQVHSPVYARPDAARRDDTWTATHRIFGGFDNIWNVKCWPNDY